MQSETEKNHLPAFPISIPALVFTFSTVCHVDDGNGNGFSYLDASVVIYEHFSTISLENPAPSRLAAQRFCQLNIG